jgi:hypothetical protein
MELPGRYADGPTAWATSVVAAAAPVRRDAARPRATWAIPGMLPGYVFERRSGQRHGLPAAIPIHPAP